MSETKEMLEATVKGLQDKIGQLNMDLKSKQKELEDVVAKKRVYIKEPFVMYDNTEDQMSQDFIFQSNQTRKLNVKVYVPDDGGDEMSSGLSGSNYACIGLLIEHQPGIITGFSRSFFKPSVEGFFLS